MAVSTTTEIGIGMAVSRQERTYKDYTSNSLPIRESVDSLCRDGADTPIVRVHRKAFLTRERSRSKPFWAPSYSIPVVRYPTIPPK